MVNSNGYKISRAGSARSPQIQTRAGIFSLAAGMFVWVCLGLSLAAFALPAATPPGIDDDPDLPANEEYFNKALNKPGKAVKHVLGFASLGQYHSLVLDGDSTLWVFGDNSYGQLGLGGQAAAVGPVALRKNVKTVLAGPNHSFAITQDGTLWAFGNNSYGQLGNGSLVDDYRQAINNDGLGSALDPAQNPEMPSGVGQVEMPGNKRLNGPNWSTGAMELGSATNPTANYPANLAAVTGSGATPISPVLSRAMSVAASARHTLVLDETGNVWAFGNNSQGQLGTGNNLSSPSPLKVMGGASTVVAGSDFSLAVAREYTLWAWGGNASGQLGTGSTKNCLTPSPVLSQVLKAVAGSGHVLALRTDDSLWAWGGNKYGQVGDGSTEMRLAPIKIMDNVGDIAAGPAFSLALGLDGRLWAWGKIGSGSGTGTQEPEQPEQQNQWEPDESVQLPELGNLEQRELPQLSELSTPAEDEGDKLVMQIGQAEPELKLPNLPATPSQAVVKEGGGFFGQNLVSQPSLILSNIAQISVADQCCLALGNDGKLWFWGRLAVSASYAFAETPSYEAPTPRLLAEKVEMAVAGEQHILFIKQDGSLWGMGNNFSGQTGNKNLELIAIPQKVRFKLN